MTTASAKRRVARLSVTNPSRIQAPKGQPFALRLEGPWQPRQEGHIGVAGIKTDAVDYVLDLKTMPWPIEDNVVDHLQSEYYLHRLTIQERITFYNESWRVLKPAAQLSLVLPNWASMKAFSDPRTVMPPFTAYSFEFLKKAWRETDHFDDLDIKCDFDVAVGYGLDPDIVPKNREFQEDAVKFKINSALDLHVTLSKKA